MKLLEVRLDKMLTFNIHIEKLITKYKRALNVMRCLVGCEWGASHGSLKNIYCSIIRSANDYGCLVYGTASDTLLKKIDVIQMQALRMC